jgi:hypothetical protein
MAVMNRVEDGILLKLKGTSFHGHNSAYLSHHDEGTMPSSLLWHARFTHINYDNLCLLKNNDVSGLPTIPRNLKKCDACILGNHRKQPFHDSTSRVSSKLGLIHYDPCGPMPVPFANGNRYIMNFIYDYTKMCWVYSLKDNSQDFETFKNFHSKIIIGSLHTDNVGFPTSHTPRISFS